MSTEMDRRSFVGLAAAMIAAAYIPKEVVATVDRVTKEPVIRNPHIFVVEKAEWFHMEYDFSQAFRIMGRFPARPDIGPLYAAAAVSDYVLVHAKSSKVIIKGMLENIEQALRKYDKKAVIVYSGELKKAIESKGVHLEY